MDNIEELDAALSGLAFRDSTDGTDGTDGTGGTDGTDGTVGTGGTGGTGGVDVMVIGASKVRIGLQGDPKTILIISLYGR